MRDSVVFYRSFWEILENFPDPEDWRTLLRGVFAHVFDEEEPEFQDPALRIAYKHFQISADSAAARYDKAVENGNKGGRPRRWVDQKEAELAFEKLGSWTKVAEELDVSRETLRKARIAWAAQKPKNLSVSYSLSESDSVSDSDKDNKKPRQPAAGPYGPPSASAKKELRPPPLPIPKRGDKGDDGSNTC